MHLDAKSNHIFFISNFYAFRLFIDDRESTVQFKRRVPLFDPGIKLLESYNIIFIIRHKTYTTTLHNERLIILTLLATNKP